MPRVENPQFKKDRIKVNELMKKELPKFHKLLGRTSITRPEKSYILKRCWAIVKTGSGDKFPIDKAAMKKYESDFKKEINARDKKKALKKEKKAEKKKKLKEDLKVAKKKLKDAKDSKAKKAAENRIKRIEENLEKLKKKKKKK